MAVRWYLIPYKRRPGVRPVRYVAMDDYTALGVAWSEAECLGDHAVVKANAADALLDVIESSEPSYHRLPTHLLDTTLRALTGQQRSRLLNKVLALGYTQAELDQHLGTGGGLLDRTLGDVVRFVLRRRQRPRYDAASDAIVLDGPDQPCKALDVLMREVAD